MNANSNQAQGTNRAPEMPEGQLLAARKDVSALSLEMKGIDRDIARCEQEAAQQADEAAMQDALGRRARLLQRKEALPFLLRSAKARVLRALGAGLQSQADALAPELSKATTEMEVSGREFDEARAALERATARKKADELAHKPLSRRHEDLSYEAALLESDATRMEKGQEPLKPRHFDE